MSDRKLAYVVVIDSLHPIEGADRIELAVTGGWQVVAQKGLYTPGCKAIYFEVDSLLDTTRPQFDSLKTLSSKLLHVIDGKVYARIKTMKLRKQLSQGYMIPLDQQQLEVGTDLTMSLGVLKYEKAAEKAMNGTPGVKTGSSALGFPKFIPKTDQSRVQNISTMYAKAVEDAELFEKTYKLDGSSLTVWVRDGVPGVASRNVGFRMEDEKRSLWSTLKLFGAHIVQRGFKNAKWQRVIKADDNAFTQMAAKAQIVEAIRKTGRNLAFQGEMVGPSIQGNFEGVTENQFYVYDIYDIDAQKYLLPKERVAMLISLGVTGVPTLGIDLLPTTVQQALTDADGPSGLNGKYREGFVYKSATRDFSFKVISNTYLLKEE